MTFGGDYGFKDRAESMTLSVCAESIILSVHVETRWEHHTLSACWEYHTLSRQCWEYHTLSMMGWEYDALSITLRASYSQHSLVADRLAAPLRRCWPKLLIGDCLYCRLFFFVAATVSVITQSISTASIILSAWCAESRYDALSVRWEYYTLSRLATLPTYCQWGVDAAVPYCGCILIPLWLFVGRWLINSLQ
jgi:hypothetical protein